MSAPDPGGPSDRDVPRDVWRVLPDSPVGDIAAHVAAGGGGAVDAAVAMGPDGVLGLLAESGLRGRGGGAYPVADKWAAVRRAARVHGGAVVVANGAEGEPGSGKDRLLLARSPYAVVEGLLVALHVVEAADGVLAVTTGDGTGRARLDEAVAAARAAQWPSADRLTVATVPDAYLSGEETALLEALEGRPPLPRVLRPDQFGLGAGPRRRNPTLVANVETLARVARLVAHGPAASRADGTARPGSVLVTVVGDVAWPGVREVASGTTLAAVLAQAGADGVVAVLAGASGGVVPPTALDTRLADEDTRAAGFVLGSGAFIVLGPDRCVVQAAAVTMRFLAEASCGQCLACSGGTADLASTLARIDRGDGRPPDVERVRGRARWLTDGVRCGLPAGAQLLVDGLLRWFGDDLRRHVGRGCHAARPLVLGEVSPLGRGQSIPAPPGPEAP